MGWAVRRRRTDGITMFSRLTVVPVQQSFVTTSATAARSGSSSGGRASSLPYFQQWHVLLGNGHNVVALEPSTLHVSGRVAARAAGVLDVIEPGAVRMHELVLSLLHGGEEIAAAETRLSASASNQKGSPT